MLGQLSLQYQNFRAVIILPAHISLVVYAGDEATTRFIDLKQFLVDKDKALLLLVNASTKMLLLSCVLMLLSFLMLIRC